MPRRFSPAIQRARTPEEEATLRDRLGVLTLEIDRLTAPHRKMSSTKAQAARITLPTPPEDYLAISATTDQELIKEFLRLVGERRAAEAERDRGRANSAKPHILKLSQQLQQALLRVSTLDTQTKAVEERARRASVALPSLTSDLISCIRRRGRRAGGP